MCKKSYTRDEEGLLCVYKGIRSIRDMGKGWQGVNKESKNGIRDMKEDWVGVVVCMGVRQVV